MTPVTPSNSAPESDEQNSVSNSLRRTLHVLRKRFWTTTAIVIVGITASVLWTLRQPKIYEATATIIVNPQMPRVNKDDDVIDLGAGSFALTREYYNTQRQVLSSFPIARATVQQGSSPRFFDLLAPPAEYPGLTEAKRIDAASDQLISMLKIAQDRDSRVIAIRIRSENPDLAQALANAHVDSYIGFMRQKKSSGTGQLSQVRSAQLDDAEKQLRAADERIQKFKATHDLITQSFDDKQNTVVQDLQRYSAALADARVRRTELSSLRTRAQALGGEDVLESPIFGLSGTSTVADELKAEYIRSRARFAEIDATYGPRSEVWLGAKQKVDQLHAQLVNEAKRVVREIEERYQAAVAAEKGYEQLVEERKRNAEALDKLYAEYAPLVRDQRHAEEQYAKLTARLDSTRQEGQNDILNVDPHELARGAEQVLPRMKLNVALAAILSLLLGIGLAFLLEHLDRTINGSEGLDALVGAPILGVIPVLEDVPATPEGSIGRDLYVFNNSTSQVAECCRAIRTNIMFSAAERPMKTITVSSAKPQEGKTTTTIYMGTTMAQSGQRVLLVDTDLRRPRLHKSLGIGKERGLTTLLLGEASYEEVIKPTEIPNLFVLPCGPQPPNPAELLLTKRFKAMLEELTSRFDRVLLDSPPLLAVTDAVVLARLSDGVILVAQSGRTNVDEVTAAVRQVRDVDAPILGVIVNSVDIADRRYGYHYGYYGYGSYGDNPKPKAG